MQAPHPRFPLGRLQTSLAAHALHCHERARWVILFWMTATVPRHLRVGLSRPLQMEQAEGRSGAREPARSQAIGIEPWKAMHADRSQHDRFTDPDIADGLDAWMDQLAASGGSFIRIGLAIPRVDVESNRSVEHEAIRRLSLAGYHGTRAIARCLRRLGRRR